MKTDRRPIPTWEGVYEATSEGDIWSVDRTVWIKNPKGVVAPRTYRARKLKATPNVRNRYLAVSLVAPGRRREFRAVHVLVAEAFHGPCPDTLEVRHLDGTRSNNAPANLQYGTRSQNALDRHVHGTMNQPRGEQAAAAKLNTEDVRWIREHGNGASQRLLGELFGVAHSAIGSVLRGKTYKEAPNV